MQKSETIAYRVFHPKQEGPTAARNRELEELVRTVVSHSSETDVGRRFFGIPNREAIPGSMTGSIPDQDVQPRDLVIVAFANGEPVGYTDIARIAGQADRVEMAMLVRTDLQRKGIGKTLMQAMIQALRHEGVTHIWRGTCSSRKHQNESGALHMEPGRGTAGYDFQQCYAGG